MRRSIALAAGLAALATACTSSPGTAPPGAQLGGRLAAALRPFDACDDLLEHLRSEAVERVGPYGLPGTGGGPIGIAMGGGDEGFAVADDTAARSEAVAGAGSGGEAAPAPVDLDGGEGYSGTNVQEAGVDEPDLLKTDGERLLAIASGSLHVIDVTGDSPRRLGSVGLPGGHEHELLVAGERALVVTRGFDDGGGGPEPLAVDMIGRPSGGGELTVLSEVDLSDPSAPSVVRSVEVEGRYLSARQVGEVARVVVRSQPDELGFVYPSTGGPEAEERAAAANREVVEESTLEQWLPSVRTVGGEDERPLTACDQVSRPGLFSGFGTLSVVTVDLGESLRTDETVSVLADGETIYASAQRLYVATNRWVDPALDVDALREAAEDHTTELHAFAIDGDGAAEYLASGSVPGHLLNQFSMSEHEGRLRIATTEGVSGMAREGTSESAVRVLEQRDGALVEVGHVGGLGRDERIFAVRFIGDVGYVVTFRQTDPLYTIDLADPTAPRVVGELKILGFSSYLHPVGDGLLLGVGQDATEEGRVTGSQVSLFDVSDPANPVRRHQLTLGEGSSDVEHDHRAFLWWPDRDLAVLPLHTWSFDEESGTESGFVGAVGLRVDPGTGIAEVGRLEHTVDEGGRDEPVSGDAVAPGGTIVEEPIPSEPLPDRPFRMGEPIRRSVVVGDTLYTLSEQRLEAADLGTLTETGAVDLR